MRRTVFFAAVLIVVLLGTNAVYSQNNADTKAINQLLDKFCEFESAQDMTAQAKLMTADRVWVGGAFGRMTDQKLNMAIQQANMDETDKLVPGIKWFNDARDRLIKFYGNGSVAVASFYWHQSFVLPGDTPLEKAALFTPVQPFTMTLVLEKKSGNWKIVHAHSSPLGAAPDGNN